MDRALVGRDSTGIRKARRSFVASDYMAGGQKGGRRIIGHMSSLPLVHHSRCTKGGPET